MVRNGLSAVIGSWKIIAMPAPRTLRISAVVAILLGWWYARRVVLSWPAVLSPLLFIPVALQQKVVANSPVMWELRENKTVRFSVDYLWDNLNGAWHFFDSQGFALANSRLLTWLGPAAALLVAGLVVAKRRRGWVPGPMSASLLLFGGGMFAITTLMMFYYWAAFDDPMASRFALPAYLLLILCLVVAAAWADRRVPASIVLLGVAGTTSSLGNGAWSRPGPPAHLSSYATNPRCRG